MRITSYQMCTSLCPRCISPPCARSRFSVSTRRRAATCRKARRLAFRQVAALRRVLTENLERAQGGEMHLGHNEVHIWYDVIRINHGQLPEYARY